MQDRQRQMIRDSITTEACFTKDLKMERASQIFAKFLVASSARSDLLESLQNYPGFVKYWQNKWIKVKKMLKRKRKFLSSIFEREKRIMLNFYQGKKKQKKVLQKLQNMKTHNIERIMDDYFYGVCYEFYKRQMHIWILLSHKYLRTSMVDIEDRRFLY